MENKPKHRLLTNHDRIERDDELLEDDCETWTKASEAARLFIGSPYNPAFYVPMRRKIED